MGGAMAAILMMHLMVDGYEIEKVITFGQPKVINHKGAKKYRDAPLLRVVDRDDLVPLVPPLTIVSALHGSYAHFGEEVMLLEGKYYSFVTEGKAHNPMVESFWLNLGHESLEDHFMKNYLKRIKPKLDGGVAVPYNKRHEYE
ncbi:MAG: hypothetical protein GY849_22270 [Deltaproteobacteria bacterium]|nr:hypothetical protein [Deltaproteobacteria bacterium]